jgi:Domain of unknown function (DUF4440)
VSPSPLPQIGQDLRGEGQEDEFPVDFFHSHPYVGRLNSIRKGSGMSIHRERASWILLLTLACGLSGPSMAAQAKSPGAASAEDDKKQVLNLEDAWVVAENKQDVTTLQRVLDDKFVSSSGAKKPVDKQAFIREIVSGDVDPSASQILSERSVILDGDTAVVVGTDTASGVDGGRTLHGALPIYRDLHPPPGAVESSGGASGQSASDISAPSSQFAAATRPYQSPESFTVRF